MEGLKRLLVRLAEFEVKFAIAGGYAAALQGSSLVTQDVDVVCDMGSENITKVFEALACFSPVHRMTPDRILFTREQAERGGLKNLYLATEIGQLDCLGEIKGLGDFAQCSPLCESVVVDGVNMKVLGFDALITAKRAMGRPRDLHAVLELEAIREKLRNRG